MIRGDRPAKTLVFLLIFLLASKLQLQAAQNGGFSQIDRIIEDGIAEKKFPGAVVIIGHHGRVVFHKAYGNRSLIPQPEAMTEDTVFDVASLTKVLATAPAVMQLYQQGRL